MSLPPSLVMSEAEIEGMAGATVEVHATTREGGQLVLPEVQGVLPCVRWEFARAGALQTLASGGGAGDDDAAVARTFEGALREATGDSTLVVTSTVWLAEGGLRVEARVSLATAAAVTSAAKWLSPPRWTPLRPPQVTFQVTLPRPLEDLFEALTLTASPTANLSDLSDLSDVSDASETSDG